MIAVVIMSTYYKARTTGSQQAGLNSLGPAWLVSVTGLGRVKVHTKKWSVSRKGKSAKLRLSWNAVSWGGDYLSGTQKLAEAWISKGLLQGLTLHGCQLHAKFRGVPCPLHIGRNQATYAIEPLACFRLTVKVANEILPSPEEETSDQAMLPHVRDGEEEEGREDIIN